MGPVGATAAGTCTKCTPSPPESGIRKWGSAFKLCLPRRPVEAVCPVRHQVAQIFHVDAHRPADVLGSPAIPGCAQLVRRSARAAGSVRRLEQLRDVGRGSGMRHTLRMRTRSGQRECGPGPSGTRARRCGVPPLVPPSRGDDRGGRLACGRCRRPAAGFATSRCCASARPDGPRLRQPLDVEALARRRTPVGRPSESPVQAAYGESPYKNTS